MGLTQDVPAVRDVECHGVTLSMAIDGDGRAHIQQLDDTAAVVNHVFTVDGKTDLFSCDDLNEMQDDMRSWVSDTQQVLSLV